MLRNLVKNDLKHILAIEEAVHIAPWSEETFQIVFRSGYLGWVLEVDQKIIGFIVISLHADECHILNIGVAHSYQRQGYGRQLLAHALQQVIKQGASIAYLEVRRTNSRAIALYKGMGFLQVGERKEYYPTVAGREDALILARMLSLEIQKFE